MNIDKDFWNGIEYIRNIDVLPIKRSFRKLLGGGKHMKRTLHGLDESILDRLEDRHPFEEEAAFNDWLTRHGYSSKEEYYAECQALEASEW